MSLMSASDRHQKSEITRRSSPWLSPRRSAARTTTMDATATTVTGATAATGGTTTGATGADPSFEVRVGAYLNPGGRGRRPPDAGPYSCVGQIRRSPISLTRCEEVHRD